MSLRSWLRSLCPSGTRQPARRPHPRLGVQQLEDRSTPSVTFDSAFALGDDTGRTSTNDVAVDTTGWFKNTVDFDPADPADAGDTLTAVDADAFVAKYAPDNSLVWVRRMGAKAGAEVVLDAGGNAYVVGNFDGTADFGATTLTSAGGVDAFVTKLSSGGDFQWAKRWGGAYQDSGQGVGVDGSGNVCALSQRTESGVNTGVNNGYEVVKFSSTGGAVWSKWVSTRYNLPSAGFGVDVAGNTFAGGCFIGSVDFDPGNKTVSRSAGSSYCGGFVLKLTSAGAYSWVTTYDTGHAFVRDLELSGEDVIVSTYVNSGTVLRPASGPVVSVPAATSVVSKLNTSGQHVWSAPLAGLTINDLAVDAGGGVYATGSFSGIADFDPGAGTQNRTSAGNSDVFALKLTAAGGFGWVETFGGNSLDQGNAIAVGADGTASLAGLFYSASVDFDPDANSTFDLTNPGTAYRSFLVKLRQN
jgi:hypothetical protein